MPSLFFLAAFAALVLTALRLARYFGTNAQVWPVSTGRVRSSAGAKKAANLDKIKPREHAA